MRLLRPALMTTTALLLTLTARTAAAETVDTSGVSTDPSGAHVELTHGDTWREVPARSGGGTTTGCRRTWTLSPGAFALRPTLTGDYRHVPMPPSPGPEYRTYHVSCDGTYVDSVWLRPQQLGVDPRDIAERLLRDLPYPVASVGANQSGRGLTGLESWFWVDGYTAAPIRDTVTSFGMTVEVEATPGSVGWDFGDGSTQHGGGLGTPAPGRSEIVHTFEIRGRPTWTVRALIVLGVRWRADGGPWQTLAPVVRTATLPYRVVESRAALVPDR